MLRLLAEGAFRDFPVERLGIWSHAALERYNEVLSRECFHFGEFRWMIG
ncbi:hypothetical protein [Coleofasciculus sp. G2-EDA-02]